MPVLSNPKHELFAQELAKGATACDSYEKAGYKKDTGHSSRLAGNGSIKARVQEIQGKKVEKIVERAAISRILVLNMLQENAERSMQVRPVLGPEGEEIGQYTYNGAVANRALELIGKEIGMFVERKEFRMVDEFEKLSDEQLVAKLAQTAQLLLEHQPSSEETPADQADDDQA